MSKKIVIYGFILIMIQFNCEKIDRYNITEFRGPYLGQKLPGDTPELFAPGIVSTRHYENSITISPDGTKLFFASYRPVEANAPPRKDWDIWVVHRTKEGWSQPKNLGSTINTDGRESSPSVTLDGTLYFKRSASGSSDIYRSRFVNGQYGEPEKLGDAINSETSEDYPFITPDESYLLFSSWRRPHGYGEADLYISFRQSDDSWIPARNLGDIINTDAHENCPFVSPDGRFFFFNSYRKGKQESHWEPPLSYDEVMQKLNDILNGFPNIYWMDARLIEELKPKNLN